MHIRYKYILCNTVIIIRCNVNSVCVCIIYSYNNEGTIGQTTAWSYVITQDKQQHGH